MYRCPKIKLHRFVWNWSQIVRLPKRIQKKNSFHYPRCQVPELWGKNMSNTIDSMVTCDILIENHMTETSEIVKTILFFKSSLVGEQFAIGFINISATWFLDPCTNWNLNFDLKRPITREQHVTLQNKWHFCNPWAKTSNLIYHLVTFRHFYFLTPV